MERCFGTGDELYERYHDEEWGRQPEDTVDESPLFERIALEGFQSGLSWLTVLRKRAAFRAAFDQFNPQIVAGYGDRDVERLMADSGIIRNRAKIHAAISNAKVLCEMHERGERLWDVLVEHAPPPREARPRTMDDTPGSTPESIALSRHLKKLGFKFVGPVTMYATMQAIGLVDDHLEGCPVAGNSGRAACLAWGWDAI